MGKKIKEIDINAFRAYKEMQKFNFVHNKTEKVADLVTIYAPNGYGKTSFFDAVEWAVTGKIGRLGSSAAIKEELKEEEDYVLKNKDSKSDYGSVKIIDEDDNVIQVNTKKKKGNMKGDYKPGELKKISHALEGILNEKNTFCTTNLLAHDKITGFLQTYTAEDKTSELRVMWDEDNYSEILDAILELYNELEKKKKQLSSDIKKEEKELGKYEFEKEQVSRIEKLIARYAEIYGKEILERNVELLSKIDDILKEFHKLYEQTQREKEKMEDTQGVNELLVQGYSLFVNNRSTVLLKKQQKKDTEKAIEIWEQIEKDSPKKEKAVKEFQKFTRVLTQLKEFYRYVEKISVNEKDIAILEKKKTEFEKEKVKLDGEIQKIERMTKNIEDSLKKLQEKIGELKQDSALYISDYERVTKYNNLKIKAKSILDQRDRRINKLSSDITLIEMFLEGKSDVGKVCGLVSQKVIDEYDAIHKLKEDRTILLENTEILESNRENIIVLFDKMQQLKIQGKDIVIERNQRECPLCHMEYRNCEELIGKIEEDKNKDKELQKIDSQIHKNKEKLQEIEFSVKEMEKEVSEKISHVLDEYKELYSDESRKINRVQKKIEYYSHCIDNCQNLCKSIGERYFDKGITISNINEVKNYEESMEKDKKTLKDNLKQCIIEIQDARAKLEIINKSITDYSLKILDIKEQNRKTQNEPLYMDVEQFLVKSDFYKPEKNYIEVNEIMTRECNCLSQHIKELDSKIEKYKTEVKETKEGYQAKLNLLIKEINEINMNIDDYLLRCKNVVGIVDNDEEIFSKIMQKQTEMESRLEIIKEKMQSENYILTLLGNLKEHKMWLDRKQACELNKTKLEFLNQRIEKLKESKKYVEDFVVERTNDYFNSDIINQIYNKIDPHPTMKHIKFVTDGKKGLKTHIYTYDDSEENTMSPVLYLSSAQVNILSLCIFLAKVLSEKETTFNTIFMDDPIQHLDGINLLAFIDILRTITTKMGRQIIISTHNEQFYNLLKVKMDERYYPSKFIVLNGAGVIKK